MASTLRHGSRTRLVLVAFLAILQGLSAGRLVTDIWRGTIGGYFFDWPPCISWALIAAVVSILFGRIEKQGKAAESTG